MKKTFKLLSFTLILTLIAGVFLFTGCEKVEKDGKDNSFKAIKDVTVELVAMRCMRSGALPRPLPPLVANGTMVFPEKSYDSKNVSMIRGSVYHHMGKPTNTAS